MSSLEPEPVSTTWVSGPRGDGGQRDAAGQRRWMAAETEADSVCEQQLWGAACAIHLTSDQAM